MMSRSEEAVSSSQVIFITLFCAGAQVGWLWAFLVPATTAKLWDYAEPKTILLSQTRMF
jgi:hypothetical protein